MEINKILVVGITGGIGNAFLQETANQNLQITGCFNKDLEKADSIISIFPSVQLKQIDLSNQFSIDNLTENNFDGLLYVAGKPHFSQNLFDFTNAELSEQFNINVYSFIAIINSIVSKSNCSLKKIVFVSSVIPDEIKSIYHLTKIIQEKAIEFLKVELNRRGISISVIKTGWVDTKMYAAYQSSFNSFLERVKHPSDIAKICLTEFQDTTTLFKIITA